MRRLRPFVNFNHDLRFDLNKSLNRSEKARITRAYNQLGNAIAGKYVVYRPKRPDNIARAQKHSGLSSKYFKAYPISSPTGEGVVRWRGDEVIIEKKGAFVRTLYPDQMELAVNPREYLNNFLDDGKMYIINSKNDWYSGGVKSAVIEALEHAMFKYGWAESVYDEEWEGDDELSYAPDDEYAEAAPKEHFEITIIEVDTRDRKTFREYREARKDEATKLKEARRRQKVRERSAKRRGRKQPDRRGRGK